MKVGDTVQVWSDMHGHAVATDSSYKHKLVSAVILVIDGTCQVITWAKGNTLTRQLHHSWKQIGHNVLPSIALYEGSRYFWVDESFLVFTPELDLKPEVKVIREPGMPNVDGACCSNCKTFTPYQSSGFTCRACKNDPYRCRI